jgi:hypothetical protein
MAQDQLNLDELLLEPGRIVAPDGGSASLRWYDEDDVIALLRVLQGIQGKPEASAVLVLADALVGFCADEEAGRRVVDCLPLPRIMDVIMWLQTADAADFAVPDAPDGEIVMDGAVRAVRLLTVGTFRNMVAGGGADLSGDVASALAQNAEVMASMVDGMTAEEWRSLPRQKSAAIERYVNGLLNARNVQVEAARPKARTRRARSTASR